MIREHNRDRPGVAAWFPSWNGKPKHHAVLIETMARNKWTFEGHTLADALCGANVVTDRETPRRRKCKTCSKMLRASDKRSK